MKPTPSQDWDIAGPGPCRSASRNRFVPTNRYYFFGFRVVAVPASAGP